MRILLFRHATRKRGDPGSDEYIEKRLPLDTAGEEQAKRQGDELIRRGIKPAAYFTSCFAHAKQTGEILCNMVGGDPPAKVVELCALTPHYQGPRESRGTWQGISMLQTIIRELELTGNDLNKLDVVVFVMHQPRLQQLLASMTSQSESKFKVDYSEGVFLRADSLDDFSKGKGQEDGPRLSLQ